MATVQARIDEIVRHANTGAIFSIYDFVPLGNYESSKKVLIRLEKEKKLERIMNGLYFKPGILYSHPQMDDIAEAIAVKFGWLLAPSGEKCLYSLGLKDHIQNPNDYLSSGPYRVYRIFGEKLTFLHTTPRDVAGLSEKTILVVQALKEYGRDNVPTITLEKISRRLTEEEKTSLLSETSGTTTWVRNEIVRMLNLYP